jgi:phosphomannomutase/phosphoglucomutase
MGAARPVTFGPTEITRIKEIVLNAQYAETGGGSYRFVENFFDEHYMKELTDRPKLKRKLKVICACGNGTPGAFAPQVLEALGCEVIRLDCELDHTFPRYNPNPEDMEMLHAMAHAIKEHGADVALGFDGDGDRCGVVDNTGEEIFADKIGVMLARDLASVYKNPTFVVDVKSTGLFHSDPVLKELNVTTDYWKTGHSYIKRRVNELKALAGFEKSGHFFFNTPIGRGYDDGILTAVAVCQMMERQKGKTLAQLREALPKTWSSPTMSPYCPDEKKYGVVEKVTEHYQEAFAAGKTILGQKITGVVTVNGVRVTLADGTWGLVRASSNKPSLVVVVESPVSEALMHAMFEEVDSVLRQHPSVGEYDQKLKAA